MEQVKIFTDRRYDGLEESINYWLDKTKNIKTINILLNNDDPDWIVALIHYKIIG